MSTYYATKAYVASLTQAIGEELRQNNSPIYVGCLCPGPVDTDFNEVANVQFALKGISAYKCANYAVDKMFRRTQVIIPTLRMKLAIWGRHVVTQKFYIRMTAGQQQKKLQEGK